MLGNNCNYLNILCQINVIKCNIYFSLYRYVQCKFLGSYLNIKTRLTKLHTNDSKRSLFYEYDSESIMCSWISFILLKADESVRSWRYLMYRTPVIVGIWVGNLHYLLYEWIDVKLEDRDWIGPPIRKLRRGVIDHYKGSLCKPLYLCLHDLVQLKG